MADFTLGKLTPKGMRIKHLDDGRIAHWHSVGNVVYLRFIDPKDYEF